MRIELLLTPPHSPPSTCIMDAVKKFTNKVKKEWDARTPAERAGLIASLVVATAGVVLIGRKVGGGGKADEVSEMRKETITTTNADGNVLKVIVRKVTSAVSGKQ